MKEIKNNTRNDILLFWKYLNNEYSTNKSYLSNIIEFAHFQNLLDISWYELLQKYENYIPKIEDTYKHQIGDHVMLYVWKSCYLDKGNTKTCKEYLMNIVNFLLEKN